MIEGMFLTTCCAGCDTPGAALCRTCRFALLARHDPSAPRGVLVACAFAGRARDVLLGFKFRNRRGVAGHLAGLLVNRLARAGERVDIVTWAPTGRGRRRGRGYDQAELIARNVARQLGVPCRRLLERQASAGAQTGRSRTGRLSGPAFRARPGLPPARVLVVDDVVTTGSTLMAAERALRLAGAASVVRAAVAATPGDRAVAAKAA